MKGSPLTAHRAPGRRPLAPFSNGTRGKCCFVSRSGHTPAIRRMSFTNRKRCSASVGDGIMPKCSKNLRAVSSASWTAKARIPAMSAAWIVLRIASFRSLGNSKSIAHATRPSSMTIGSCYSRFNRGTPPGGTSRAERQSHPLVGLWPNRVRPVNVFSTRTSALSNTNSLTDRFDATTAA